MGSWDTILGSFGVLESHLGALGASWDPPGRLWETLGVLIGALVELLGGSWGAFEVLLAALGGLLGARLEGPQSAPRGSQSDPRDPKSHPRGGKKRT